MLIFQMILECATPLHCGSGAADLIYDQPVARDAWGLWRIPGSSLAGSLRALGDGIDHEMAEHMFGRQEGESSFASLVWCNDALLLDFDNKAAALKKQTGEKCGIHDLARDKTFIRDHVCLDLERDSAVEGGKFDAEIVPAGARFLVEFRCDAWCSEKNGRAKEELTEAEKAYFAGLCARVLAGELELGGKGSNGYGRYNVLESRFFELDPGSPADMETWLNMRYGSLAPANAGTQVPLDRTSPKPAADNLRGDMRIPLVCEGPILIGGGSPAPGDAREDTPDMLFALTPWLNYEKGAKNASDAIEWRWVIPGSALKGVFRHAVYNILRDLDLDEEAAEKFLSQIFGKVNGEEALCGKLAFEDCLLAREGKGAVVQHVAIDRFTGGAVDGALFNEEPLWQPGLRLAPRISVRGVSGGHAALIFHALLDLADGMLSVGSGANRGNGRLAAEKADAFLQSLAGSLQWNGKPLLGPDNSGNMSDAIGEWDIALLDEVLS